MVAPEYTYLDDKIKCPKCKIEKFLEEFHLFSGCCNYCTAATTAAKNKRKAQKRFLWNNSRMTEEQYKQMVEDQGGVCAICGTPEEYGALSVDHDRRCCSSRNRSCGECIRGLLCSDCQLGVTRFYDDAGLLDRAIDYILYWNKQKE